MPKKIKKIAVGQTFDSIMELANKYCVETNPLFIIAAQQYQTQQKIIDKTKKELLKSDSLITQKTYVKGRENYSAHPLIKELPKLADAANKTLVTMVEIIKEFGKEREQENGADAFDDL